MKYSILIALTISSIIVTAQNSLKIETSDIDNFWLAVDQLEKATTRDDSINLIQKNYIDLATPEFQKFIKARNFTAAEYVDLLADYPEFWKSIKPLTVKIGDRKEEIELVMQELSTVLPDFKTPNVCFAIGCLRTGGTTTKDLILIGSEIAAADSTVIKTELSSWLNQIIGTNGDIVSMVAHEAVHTQQSGFPLQDIFSLIKHKNLSLLNASIMEGSCDFITDQYLDLNINSSIHLYGNLHYCELFEEFRSAIAVSPFDYSNFLYNGRQIN